MISILTRLFSNIMFALLTGNCLLMPLETIRKTKNIQHSDELLITSIELVLLPPGVPPPFFCALVNRSNSAAASDRTDALSEIIKKSIK